MKLIKKFNKRGKSAMNRKSKSCLLKGKMTSGVLATWLSLACHYESKPGGLGITVPSTAMWQHAS